MVKSSKTSKKEEGKDEIDKVLDELLMEDEEPKKKSAKKAKKQIEVKEEEVSDLDGGKVSYAEIIEILCELPKEDFRKVIKVARQVRRTNNMIATYFGEEEQ